MVASAALDCDAELMLRVKDGDGGSFALLLEKYRASVIHFLYRMVQDQAVSEELAQEVFLRVYRSRETYEPAAKFTTWLFRIAANKARDYRERLHAAKRGGGQTTVSLQAEDAETGLTLDPPSSAPGPDAALMSAEQIALVQQALDELGEPCREIIQLRYFGDLSYDEISRSLDLNPKTVSSRLSKCLDRLEGIARNVFSREKSAAFPSNM